jgi:hypothetical protein
VKFFISYKFPRNYQASQGFFLQRIGKSSYCTKEIIIDIAFSCLYVRLVGFGMIVCLGCIYDASIVTIGVVVVIVGCIRVVTTSCTIDKLDPTLLTPLTNTMPKTVSWATKSQTISLFKRCLIPDFPIEMIG